MPWWLTNTAMAACGVAAGLAFLGTSEDINQAFEAYIAFLSMLLPWGGKALLPAPAPPTCFRQKTSLCMCYICILIEISGHHGTAPQYPVTKQQEPNRQTSSSQWAAVGIAGYPETPKPLRNEHTLILNILYGMWLRVYLSLSDMADVPCRHTGTTCPGMETY